MNESTLRETQKAGILKLVNLIEIEPKNSGVIRHIGISSHNPKVAMKAAEVGYVEMMLFIINPAFDMLPASENIDTMFAEEFDAGLKGIDADSASCTASASRTMWASP